MKRFWKKKNKREKENDKSSKKKGNNTIYIMIIAIGGMGAETVYTDVLDREIFPSTVRIQQEKSMDNMQREIISIKQQQFRQQLQQQQMPTVLSVASHEELSHVPEPHVHNGIIAHQHELAVHDHATQFIEHDHDVPPLPEHAHDAEEHQHEDISQEHTHDIPDVYDRIFDLESMSQDNANDIIPLQDGIVALEQYNDEKSRGPSTGGGGGIKAGAVSAMIDAKLTEFESANNSLLQTLLDRLTRVSIIQDGQVEEVAKLRIETQHIDDDLDELLAFLANSLPQLCNPAEFNNPFCL